MKYILLLHLSFLIILTSCRPSIELVKSTNRNNLNKISLGMTKSEVIKIMGTITITMNNGIIVTNPYRSETMNENDKNFEILFYYTDTKKEDGVITDDELTPIVIYENKVVGYGWRFLKDNVKRYQLQLDIR